MKLGIIFTLLVILAEALGLTAVGLIITLSSKYWGGYAWDGSEQQFNLHPALMVVGFLFFYGNSILVYKVGAGTKLTKFTLKVIHFILHLVAFIMCVIGLVAVFQYHNAQGFANARSLHSWMGLSTVVFFGLQLVLGFLFFLFPRAREETRATVKPVHVFFGVFILGMVVVTVLTGLTEKILFTDDGFDKLSPMVVITNVFALVVLGFVGVVTYIVTTPVFTFLQEGYDRVN